MLISLPIRYWRFTNQDMDDGYPKEIEKGFEGIPNNVDAAFVWTGNEKIYFFKVRQCLELHLMKYIFPSPHPI